MNAKDVCLMAKKVNENVSRVIIGKENVIDMMMTAILARGHILLEDVPGTGKTVMAKSMAKSMDADFSRIQFTPDLLPSDITGSSVYRQDTGKFEFHPGPVFTNILLADEINRATPRTQSAMLECMEERTVTEGGETRRLAEPFLVIATQNPVETQGTFPLPEAQLDRFLMKLTPGYPTNEESVAILARFLKDEPLEKLQSVCTSQEIAEAQNQVRNVEVAESVQRYISSICIGTRQDPQCQLGVSPRGMLALMHACQAYALIKGREFVTPDDVQTLAMPVLSHRVIAKGMFGRSEAAKEIVQKVLQTTAVPTEEN